MFGFVGRFRDELAAWEKRAVEIEAEVRRRIRRHEPIAKNVELLQLEQATIGERLADRLAAVAGSWPFIVAFAVVLAAWVLLNTVALVGPWDDYPFILLNLVLSTLAAIQAPVIMMSQNRAEERDRLRAEHDYEVNLKAELEIQELHVKLDQLRETQVSDLLAVQKRQVALIEELISRLGRAG
jgi:uncharacterized membrane protein